jgi:hypothetical protein
MLSWTIKKTYSSFGFFTRRQGEIYTQYECVKEVGEEVERRREADEYYYVN